MSSLWLRTCTIALVLTALCTRAFAEPRIVLVSTIDAPPMPALATQLRVHAGRPLRVITVGRSTTASTIGAQVPALLRDTDAIAVIWIAPVGPAGSDGLMVFAAGPWPGRALIELVRLAPMTPPADAERIIALKMAGLLDAVLTRSASP